MVRGRLNVGITSSAGIPMLIEHFTRDMIQTTEDCTMWDSSNNQLNLLNTMKVSQISKPVPAKAS